MQAMQSFPRWQRITKQFGWTGVIGLAILIGIIIAYNDDPLKTTAVLASTIRQSTPLVLGALCGLMGERAGVINIGIEGQMLLSAFAGFMVNVWIGNVAPDLAPGLRLLAAVSAGVLIGALLGLLLAFMSVTLKIDQIIGGTVINILALGLTGYFYVANLTTLGKLQAVPIPVLSEIPLIGKVLFDNPPITYATIILVFLIHYVLFSTRWGLRTRAVGEHPRAADTLGVNVYRVRYINVIIGGALAGLAGAFLTLEAVGSFERAMTNGRGFVALAVMIFGKWTPLGSWGAALLFGFANAMQTQLQFGGQIDIPHQFIGMIPYVLTIIVLAGFVGRARPPAADGIPYEKE
jgi:simple sugar transport system permease protein